MCHLVFDVSAQHIEDECKRLFMQSIHVFTQPVNMCQRAVTSARIDPAAHVQAKSNATNVLSSSQRAWRRSRTANLPTDIHTATPRRHPNTNTRGLRTPRPQHTATMSIAPQRGAPPKRSSTVLVRHSHLPLPLHIPINPHSRPRFRPRLVSRGLRSSRAVHG